MSRFLNFNTGYITNINRQLLFNDEPKLFSYSAIYRSESRNSDNFSNGISFDMLKAVGRVFGEGLERYCLDNCQKKLITKKINQLNQPFLHPLHASSFSKKQLQKNSFSNFNIHKDSIFRWIEGYSISQDQDALIPAQLVFTTYKPIYKEPLIRNLISTGAAANTSLEKAIYSGICEVIERDAFMIAYLNKLNSPLIDIKSSQDEDIKKINYIFNRYRLELVILEITTDILIPAFAAITLDKTGLGPSISVGLKAGFNIKETIIGAIEESLMVRSWLRDNFVYNKTARKLPKTIRTIEDRAFFWFKPESFQHLDFWLTNRSLKKINLETSYPYNILYSKALSILIKTGLDIFYVDITHEQIKRFGFAVVKVIIPQMQPLYLDDKYPYLGNPRLYEVPVKLNLWNKPYSVGNFNKIPHPFL